MKEDRLEASKREKRKKATGFFGCEIQKSTLNYSLNENMFIVSRREAPGLFRRARAGPRRFVVYIVAVTTVGRDKQSLAQIVVDDQPCGSWAS